MSLLWPKKCIKSERTKEIKGFVVYEAVGLQGEPSEDEIAFLKALSRKLYKVAKGHHYGGIKLISLTLDID